MLPWDASKMSDDGIELDAKHFPQLAGLRHNGHRWVDETRADRPMLVVIPHEQLGKDIFGGSGEHRPPRQLPRKLKSRRRGPART